MSPISIDFLGYELYSSDAKCPCELEAYIKFQSVKQPDSVKNEGSGSAFAHGHGCH